MREGSLHRAWIFVVYLLWILVQDIRVLESYYLLWHFWFALMKYVVNIYNYGAVCLTGWFWIFVFEQAALGIGW